MRFLWGRYVGGILPKLGFTSKEMGPLDGEALELDSIVGDRRWTMVRAKDIQGGSRLPDIFARRHKGFAARESMDYGEWVHHHMSLGEDPDPSLVKRLNAMRGDLQIVPNRVLYGGEVASLTSTSVFNPIRIREALSPEWLVSFLPFSLRFPRVDIEMVKKSLLPLVEEGSLPEDLTYWVDGKGTRIRPPPAPSVTVQMQGFPKGYGTEDVEKVVRMMAPDVKAVRVFLEYGELAAKAQVTEEVAVILEKIKIRIGSYPGLLSIVRTAMDFARRPPVDEVDLEKVWKDAPPSGLVFLASRSPSPPGGMGRPSHSTSLPLDDVEEALFSSMVADPVSI